MIPMFFYPLIGGFAAGILLRSFFAIGLPEVGFAAVIAAALLALGFRREERSLTLAAIVCFGIVLGICRYTLGEDALPYPLVDSLGEGRMIGTGIIVTDPDLREGNTKLTIDLDTVNGATTTLRILATVPRFPALVYGDRVLVNGILKKPTAFSGDTDRVFDYPAWLKKDGIVAVMSYPSIERIEGGGGNIIFRYLFRIKHAFLSNIEERISEPESGLLAGLLVGSKQSLGKELQDTFRVAGVIHIVVLSGYNVTIVAEAIMRALAFLPRMLSYAAGGISIILFAIMAGGSATVVRASIMAVLVLLARATGRTNDLLRALLVTGFMMLIHNPFILAFDPSFQLSFLATFGLILIAPKLEKRVTWIPAKFGIREIVVATLSTQLIVLPLLLWMTGIFSVVALPANLLILGAVPPAMLFGFLAGVLGFISTWLALPFALIADAILRYQLFVVHVLAGLPFAAFTLPAFPFWISLVAYAILALLYGRMSIK